MNNRRRPDAAAPRLARRRFLVGAGASSAAVAAAALGGTTAAADAAPKRLPVTLWGTSIDALQYPIANQTVRVMLRATLGAPRIRIRVSNAFGAEPLTVGSAFVGRRSSGAGIEPGTNRPVTFSGQQSVVIPTGAQVLSDPVPVSVRPGSDLAVSIFTPGNPTQVTGHLRPKDYSYLSGPGDYGGDEAADAFELAVEHWFWVDAVVGEDTHSTGAVVFLGDSITDSGALPRGGYQGWTDVLARRIAQLPPPAQVGVVNAGISGNRLLSERPNAGVNAQARLDRDVLSHAGVHTVMLLEGINDIYGSPATAADLITAHRQIAARVKARGLRVIAGTLLPSHRGAYTEERESVRLAVNEFLRTTTEFDGIVDFDKALRDPSDPTSIYPPYDSGDHTHPSPDGYRAMAEAVDLDLLHP